MSGFITEDNEILVHAVARAIREPEAFTNQITSYPRSSRAIEPLDHWQARAVLQLLGEWFQGQHKTLHDNSTPTGVKERTPAVNPDRRVNQLERRSDIDRRKGGSCSPLMRWKDPSAFGTRCGKDRRSLPQDRRGLNKGLRT